MRYRNSSPHLVAKIECNNQNHWVSGLRPSPGILNTRKQSFGNYLVPPSGEVKETPALFDPLEESDLNQWTTNVKIKLKFIFLPMVIPPVCPGVRHPFGAHDQIFYTVRR
jgi:hypothetical protein